VAADVLDPVVGACFCLLGAGLWRGMRGPALLAVATGVLWFVGDLAGALVLAHRGPMTHLLVGYPRARLRDRAEQAVVAAAYGDALIYPLGRLAGVTLALSVLVVAVMVRGYRLARGTQRRARVVPMVATIAAWGVLGFGAAARLTGRDVDGQVLVAYELVLAATTVALFVDARFGRWRRFAITSLAVDLGHDDAVSMRDRLADALGDPSLVLGYVDPGTGEMRDEAGQVVPLSTREPGRAVTVLRDADRPIAVLFHDAAVLDDPALLESVGSLARIALANTRLQQEAQARLVAVEESRRRLLVVADAERDRLEAELHSGPQCRLDRVARLLDELPDHAELAAQLATTQDAIQEFARGVHPRILSNDGLRAALTDLAASASVPLTLVVPDRRFDAYAEGAAYFVCAEALTNIAKYAHATHAIIRITAEPGELRLDVSDDGVGSADPRRGSGLIGLRDRIDVLGGTLEVLSPAGHGTRILAHVPVHSPDNA
jgi:signal transduction histidine kinase